MHIKSKMAVAMMTASMAAPSFAMDLGEFNGTAFSLTGYVKAEGMFTNPDDGGRSFDASARQSRIGLSMTREIEGHKVRGFIEGDFWGDNTDKSSTANLRLRHGYISIDNVIGGGNLTVGQTWNGQVLSIFPIDVGAINFFGAGNGTFGGTGSYIRPDMVMHYTLGGARFTLQDPYNPDADYPDMVFSYTKRSESGHMFNISFSGRDVDTPPFGSSSTNESSKFGAAIAAGAKFKFGNTDLSINGFTGKGAGAYTGWGYNGAMGNGISDVDTNGDLITVSGFAVGVAHQFTDKLKGIARYGQVTAHDFADTPPTSLIFDGDSLKSTNLTLIYSYLPQLDFGIEWRDLNNATRPPVNNPVPGGAESASSSLRPAGTQVEIMAMYRF